MTNALSVALLSFLCATAIHAGEWHVDTAHPGNNVQFTSEVVALQFDGTSRSIDGYVWGGRRPLFSGQPVSLYRRYVDL